MLDRGRPGVKTRRPAEVDLVRDTGTLPSRPGADDRGRGTAAVADTLHWRPSTGSDGVFFLFSNRLGCLGSILVSVIATGLLLLILNLVTRG